MKRGNTIERYMAFLNDAIETCNSNGVVKLSGLTQDHATSAHLNTFIVEKGLFDKKAHGLYNTTRNKPYTRDEVESIVKEFRIWLANKRENIPNDLHVNVDDKSIISQFTTQQLISELKKRGYTGTLEIKKQLTF